jgi:hypothetical protein
MFKNYETYLIYPKLNGYICNFFFRHYTNALP